MCEYLTTTGNSLPFDLYKNLIEPFLIVKDCFNGTEPISNLDHIFNSIEFVTWMQGKQDSLPSNYNIFRGNFGPLTTTNEYSNLKKYFINLLKSIIQSYPATLSAEVRVAYLKLAYNKLSDEEFKEILVSFIF